MKLLLRLLVVITPLALTLLLIYGVIGGDLTRFVPAEFDEVGNWHETLTFAHVGFEGGYYTFDESPAPARFSHFDTHGPFFTMFTAGIGRVFGWYPPTMVIINLAAITAALGVYVYLTRPEPRQAAMLIMLLATFWPLLLYLPSNWQESVHQSIAIVLAGIFYVVIQRGGNVSRRFIITAGGLIFAVALMRLTWSFMLVPLVVLTAQDNPAKLRRGLLLAGALIVLAFGLFWYFAAPYSLNFTYQLTQALQRSPVEALALFRDHTLYNFSQWNQGHPLEIGQRYLYLLALAACALAGTRLGRKLRIPMPEVTFHLLNLGLVFGVHILLYDVYLWRDYRVFALHLLLSLLVLVASKRASLLVGALIIGHLLFAPAFLQEYQRLRQAQFFTDPAPAETFREATAPYLVYEADAESAWCNTVLTSGFGPELLTLPPGVGFSAILNPVFLNYPLKSRYLLLRDDIYAEMQPHVRVEPLVETSLGWLYLNLDSECEARNEE